MARIAARHVRLKDDRSVVIRTTEESDAAALLGLVALLGREPKFTTFESDEFEPVVERQVEKIAKHLAAPGSLMLVAEHAGRLVGELDFHAPERRRLRHRGELGISIAQDWRGCGVGRALITELISWAEAHPVIEKLCLRVFAINDRAIALYRSLGFVEEGRRLREIRLAAGQYSDDILMARFVKPTPDCH